MSSLAASRADNFYFPPDWRPEYGGISKFAGSKGANQYQQYGVIRFELPFDAWCLKCGCHMCKGLRFNAKKDKAGNYFTTTIWTFTTKCYDCSEKFVIRTNPQLGTYDFVEGLRKKEEDFVPDVDDSLIQATDDETRRQIAADPMFALQHENEDKARAQTMSERMHALIELREDQSRQDYDANSVLRARNREKKRKAKEMLADGAKHGIGLPLLDEVAEDVVTAKNMAAVSSSRQLSNRYKTTERKSMVRIQSESIFGENANGKSSDRNISSSKTVDAASISDRSAVSSSAARKHAKVQSAMSKQAVQRIDVRNMKIQASQSNEVGRANVILVEKKDSSKPACCKTLSTAGDVSAVPKTALSLVSGYGDSDNDEE
jgi:coiled-coil domain-containing protein 130